MVKKHTKYYLVNAFTETPFKGNPATVCLLEEEKDEQWLNAVTREFNNPAVTCFLTRTEHATTSKYSNNPRFRLRWFTTVAEVEICGHGTLAAAHILFTSGLVKSNIIEFVTLYGILTAKKIFGENEAEEGEHKFSIELDLPVSSIVECDSKEIPFIPLTLNGASVVNIKKISPPGYLLVEISSGERVAELEPNFEEIKKCRARMGVLITGAAPRGSSFDFFSRLFAPKMGVNEDAVCGSAHCGLAPYWSKKLGKSDFFAYMASQRGGILDVRLDEEKQRVRIRGKAVTIMEGFMFA